jgi:hypothetical protein
MEGPLGSNLAFANPLVWERVLIMNYDERRRLAEVAVDRAMLDIFGPPMLEALKADQAEFELGREELVAVNTSLTFVDDLYLIPENLTWAARCGLHIGWAQWNVLDAGLPLRAEPSAQRDVELQVVELRTPPLPKFEEPQLAAAIEHCKHHQEEGNIQDAPHDVLDDAQQLRQLGPGVTGGGECQVFDDDEDRSVGVETGRRPT